MHHDAEFTLRRINSHLQERIRAIKDHLAKSIELHPLAQARMSGALNEAETILRMTNGENPGKEFSGD